MVKKCYSRKSFLSIFVKFSQLKRGVKDVFTFQRFLPMNLNGQSNGFYLHVKSHYVPNFKLSQLLSIKKFIGVVCCSTVPRLCNHFRLFQLTFPFLFYSFIYVIRTASQDASTYKQDFAYKLLFIDHRQQLNNTKKIIFK